MTRPPVRAARWAASLLALAATSAFAQVLPTATTAPKVDFSRIKAQLSVLMQEKRSRTPAMRKMESSLVYAVRAFHGQDIRKALPKFRTHSVIRTDGTVDVEFKGTVTPTLLAQLQVLGAQIQHSYPAYRSVSARIPLRSLESAAMLPGVGYVKPPSHWARDVGSVQSEGDKSLRADEARTAYGINGAGVKMGVISDSNDSQEASIGTGDLPATVDVPGGNNGRPGSGEGTAMMELAYDVAPGMALAFNTGGPGQEGFAQHYRDLFAAGCSVISDDIFYFDEPAFQDGIVADAVNDIFAAGGICFSSAGNAGNLRSNTSGNIELDFKDSGQDISVEFDDGSTFDYPTTAWDGASNPLNRVKTSGFGTISVQWNDSWGDTTDPADYDVIVLDADGSTIVDGGFAINGGVDAPPYEEAQAFTNEYVVVGKYSGPNRVIRANQIRGSLQFANGGQTWGHNSAANGIGVAAINAIIAPGTPRAFTAADATTSYSSDGLRRIYYDENGNQIAANLTLAGALVRNRPVVAAPDGTNTTVPNFQPFYGNSAASPHAAALAVLLKQFAPDATNVQIRDAITGGAIDILTAGYDKDSGAGAASAKGSIKVLLEGKTLGLSPASASFAGTAGTSLTLDLGRNAPPAGLKVNLTATGATTAFTFPTQVTVPAGSRTVAIAVGANGTGTGTITLTATENYSGAALGTATVTRTTGTAAAALQSVTVDPATVVGASRTVSGKVTLTANATSTFTVELVSSNPAVASVPGTVAISSGGSFKTFAVTTTPVLTDTTVTISARKAGTTDTFVTTPLVVKAPKPNSCVPNPTSGNPGTPVTFTVKLDGPAPTGGITVGLVTTDAGVIAVPRTLAFNAGETQKTFTATAGPSATKKIVTVSVRYQSATVAQGRFVILVPEVSNLTISPTSVKGGAANATGTVTLASAAPATGVTVKLSKSGAGGSIPATVTVAPGQTSKTFAVTTTAVTSTKTFKVVAKTATVSKSATLTITN